MSLKCKLFSSRLFFFVLLSLLSRNPSLAGRNSHLETEEETYSFQLSAKFDVQKEVQDSMNSLNQLRMVEERATPRNVTAQIGHPVYLHCIVEPIGDKMVSI